MTKILYKAELIDDPSIINWPNEDQIIPVLLSLHADDKAAADKALRELNETGVYRHNNHHLTRRMEVQLPFPGFYETVLDGELDRAEEQLAENEVENREGLEVEDVADALYWAIDHSNAYREIAREYADTFRDLLKEEHEIDLDMVYLTMESPREYNFTTDRLFVHMPLWQLNQLRADVDDSVLAGVIAERHTSRSGFISSYSNKLEEWDMRPLRSWDHNEFQTLLEAYLRTKDVGLERLEDMIVERLSEGGEFDAAIDEALDNEKFEAKLKEKLEEKEGGEEEPESKG